MAKLYQPSLDEHLIQGALNYQVPMRLLNSQKAQSNTQSWDIGNQGELTLKILDEFRYTTTLLIQIHPGKQFYWQSALTMRVQVYHDVRLAEVMTIQGLKKLEPKYQYPNDKMLLPNEKKQFNDFLSECVTACLSGAAKKIND